MKNQIEIADGTRLQLHAFGPATVRKLYVHRESCELVADVKTDGGVVVHLYLPYCRLVAV